MIHLRTCGGPVGLWLLLVLLPVVLFALRRLSRGRNRGFTPAHRRHAALIVERLRSGPATAADLLLATGLTSDQLAAAGRPTPEGLDDHVSLGYGIELARSQGLLDSTPPFLAPLAEDGEGRIVERVYHLRAPRFTAGGH